ncbi:MAG: serine/threonine protein kinase [Anaerolineales bacterium]|nr:MAG: serine/threonine protein kinase [Anaerolineales bacterium]
MADQFPEKFGKYKIIEEVGRGGFADVYKGIDTTLNRTVALKFLEPRLLREPTFVERFQREAQLAANLKHPNVVIIHEFGWEAGAAYMAMEFLEGRTLKEVILQEGALPPARIVNMVGQITSALDYAHGRGLVHRDIKPSNIMVEADDHVTVMDFGIAKAATQTALTTTGKIFGTPEYMSPEQAEGLEEPDARSDIYSLGVVIYEMVTGRVPFSGTTPFSIMRGHVDKPPPRPSEVNPDVSPAVEAVLLKALAKEREERYQRAGEMAAALQQAVSVAVVEEVEAPPPVVAPTELPAELQQAIKSPFAGVRAGVVQELDRLLHSSHTGLALAAQAALERLKDDDSRRVSTAATESLAAYAEAQRAREEAEAETERLAAEKAKAEHLAAAAPVPAKLLWLSILLTTIDWAIVGFQGVVIWHSVDAPETTALAIVGAIGGAINGVITGLVLRRAEPSTQWKQVLAFAIGWAVVGAVVWAIAEIIFDVAGAIAGAIVGAIGGGVMIWQLSRARRSA